MKFLDVITYHFYYTLKVLECFLHVTFIIHLKFLNVITCHFYYTLELRERYYILFLLYA